MADKTVKELAEMVGKTTDAVKQQLVDAGLPARAEDDRSDPAPPDHRPPSVHREESWE